MRPFRYILQVCTFLFFAVWFLSLVAGQPFRILEILPRPHPELPPAETKVKPSPIEMLRRVGQGNQ